MRLHLHLSPKQASRLNLQTIAMGNRVDVLTHNYFGLKQPHKVNKKKGRQGFARATLTHSTATTIPMPSMTLAPKSEIFNNNLTNDTTPLVTATPEQASPAVNKPPKPRLSTETSLMLITATEEELGGIRYEFTCLKDATMEAKKSRRPVLCIEFHIPGDVTIGREVLSHPLIVEAAETLFVPVKSMEEHVSVNIAGQISYTTVRLLDDAGLDIVKPVKDKLLSVASVASAMIEALNACDMQVPTYLALLEEEYSGRRWKDPFYHLQRTDRHAVFGMSCPNRGEVELAGLDGVLATRSCYYQGNHVVQVTYDTTRLSYCSLVHYVLRRDLTSTIFYQSNEERIVGIMERQRLNASKAELVEFNESTMNKSVDPKHFLRTTMLRFVPLTELQSTRANRLVSLGTFHEAMRLLSPRQGQILMRAIQNPTSMREEVVDVPITTAWKSISNPKPVQQPR